MAKIGTGAAEGKRTAYINANVLDGTEGMEVLENHAVVVEGRRIVDVAPLADADLSGCETFDLKGAYLLPGLINMHVHLAGNGKPQKKQRDNEALVRKIMSNGLTRAVAYRVVSEYARLELHSGVTTIRTVGGLGDFDTRVRDDATAGKLEAPRILAANMGISVPGGHMAGSVAISANSIPEALAHVESTEGVRVALECGVDSIEHGAAPTDEVMRLFKEGNSFLCTTLSPALPYALFDRSVSCASEVEQFNGNMVFEGIIANAKAALEQGVPVALGNDVGCPWITQYDFWRELCYFEKYVGVSRSFALHTATLRNAQLAGIDDITGSIEVGKEADMIVVTGNPLDDLRALRTVKHVIHRGRFIVNPRVKRKAEVDCELDKFL